MNTAPAHAEIEIILSAPDFFTAMDRHFAMFIHRLAKSSKREVAVAAALVSRSTREGNICLSLAEYADTAMPAKSNTSAAFEYVCPSLPDWTDKLLCSGVVAAPGAGQAPLVLDANGHLYLHRYWEYENIIIRFIRQRGTTNHAGLDYARLRADLKKLFPLPPHGVTDWQLIAAVAAACRPFCIISGGPGTGKTHTVAMILALLRGLYPEDRPPRILLGAPTGKAALRLQQTIDDTGLWQTEASPPLQAATLHRLLGYLPNSPYFRHNAENPLTADIVVIDEASMVDLPLMAKLMQALPNSTRLLLLGDHHQLASVQPGSFFGDICQTETISGFSTGFSELVRELTGTGLSPASAAALKSAYPVMQDSFVELLQSYRFKPGSAIDILSRAVKEGDAEGALAILQASKDDSILWSEMFAPAELGKKLLNWPGFEHYKTMQDISEPVDVFASLENCRILCALRRGPFGVERVNSLVEQQLVHQIQQVEATTDLPVRPLMITQNDYNLGLFNGDIGILQADPENPATIRAFLQNRDGQLRSIATELLPAHESVFAMTVHKSQGTEVDRILLILPDHDSPLLTRELLYTAITRARKGVEIWGSREVFTAAVKRKIKRTSGLAAGIVDRDQ